MWKLSDNMIYDPTTTALYEYSERQVDPYAKPGDEWYGKTEKVVWISRSAEAASTSVAGAEADVLWQYLEANSLVR
ncbi:hypothetical protein D6833_00305 [Candidatus Parcubacteria bacterium]|nr:MAG: hypothetical protein D6833_00305 [Candidatus Parcubacteria bacterium]